MIGKKLEWILKVGTVLLILSIGQLGCGDDRDGVDAGKSGRIQVSPDPIAFAQIEFGSSADVEVVVTNEAFDTLKVFEMKIVPRGDDGSTAGLELIDAPSGAFDVAPETLRAFRLRYTPSENIPSPRASLVFVSSDDRYTRDEPLRINIDALANRPSLEINPPVVRFTRQSPGSRDSRTITLRNVGSAPLNFFEPIEYGGGADFRISTRDVTLKPLLPYDSALVETRPEDYEVEIVVEYAPLGDGFDTGEILIVSNSPGGGELISEGRYSRNIDVGANADSPCIQVDDTSRDLGRIPIGSATADIVTITNCGSQTLEITSLTLRENSDDDEFELALGGWDLDDNQEIDAPIFITGGGEETFVVKYTPAQEGADRGKIVIVSNDPLQRELEVGLTARGSEGVCPIARIGASIRGVSSSPRPSLTAGPLEYIILDGSGSTDADGVIQDYFFEFTKLPPGVSPVLTPTQQDSANQDPSKREFRLLTAGTYEIELKVRDNQGFMSCGDVAKATIVAIPNEKISVELTWTNPEDPDETDTQGSDVDLHLVKMGPGAWFETPYDVYFRNPNNSGDGSAIWSPESPSLDIDDRDGGGPENIQMDDPANCEWYSVGVHYYKQLFGTAYVTVRIYVNTHLVFESLNKPMSRGGQFWDVARIHWDSGSVYEANNVFEAPPSGQFPEVTSSMSSSGLCTNQGLYTVP